MKYPAIPPKRHTGDEPLLNAQGKQIAALADFWSWAYSDLIGNTERGALAEFLVACALGIQDKERISWDKYDLRTEDGITIEVKASGYLQTWEQNALSTLIFGIRPTHGWDSVSGAYEEGVKRQAQIYVFCVHKHLDQATLNPLDTRQWDFYPLPAAVLDEKVGGQKTITLSSLLKLGAEKCSYEDLNQRIHTLAKQHP